MLEAWDAAQSLMRESATRASVRQAVQGSITLKEMEIRHNLDSVHMNTLRGILDALHNSNFAKRDDSDDHGEGKESTDDEWQKGEGTSPNGSGDS